MSKMGTKIKFKTKFSSIKGKSPQFKRGDIIDAYILFESAQVSDLILVYVPYYKKIVLASEYNRWPGIWRADSGFSEFSLSLKEDDIKELKKMMKISTGSKSKGEKIEIF